MIASVGPPSEEGSLLKGTSDDPSSGPLTLTLEKRLQILQKWQDQETAYTEETREFILKSRFSRGKQRKVTSIGPSSTEGSLLKGTSDDPSSGSMTLTLEERLQILQKWHDQETAYTEEIREFILKSRFSRGKQRKDYPSFPSDVKDTYTDSALVQQQDTDSALVQQQDTDTDSALIQQQDTDTDSALVQQQVPDTYTDSALVQQQDTDSALVQQQDTDSALVQQQVSDTDTDSALVQQQEQASSQSACQPVAAFSSFDLYLSKDQWCCCDVCDKCILTKDKQSHLESTLHLTNVAAMKGIPQKGTYDDPSSGPLTLTLQIQQKLSKLETACKEIKDFKLKRDFRRDKPEKVSSVGPSSTEGSPLKGTTDDPPWGLVSLTLAEELDLQKIFSRLEPDFSRDKPEKECFSLQLAPEDDMESIKSRRSPDDKASDAVELTKLGTIHADKIIRCVLNQARSISEDYVLGIPYESDFTELGNVYRHVFQISHRNKVLGTAFFFNPFPEGKTYLLTAGHVIAGYDEETVLETEGWLCFPASPVGISSIKDVGVLRFKWPLFYPFLRPLSIDLGTETSTHIYVVGCMSGALSEKCLVLPSQDKDDGFIRFQSKLFSEGSFGSPCLVFKNGQYVVKGMLIGREGGTDTPYELIAITFRCVLKRLGFP